MKTGVTPSAGPCLSSMFKINSIESIVIVLLKAKTMKMRFKETLDLLKDALNLLEYHKIEEIDKLTKQGS